jgi:hypothetical protein
MSEVCISVGRRIFYIFNLGIPVFLAYTAAMGLISLESYDGNSTAIAFQAIYMLLFAALLFIFEASQIFPIERFDNVIKMNYGFLYGVFGKGDDDMSLGNAYAKDLFILVLTIDLQLSRSVHVNDRDFRIWLTCAEDTRHCLRRNSCCVWTTMHAASFNCKINQSMDHVR